MTPHPHADNELSSARTTFSLRFNTSLWVMTTGLQFVIGWWYRKAAVFYLPPGWFGPLTWWLALPFAPAGSVSCGVWQMACRRVIKVGERAAKEIMARGHADGECSIRPSARPSAASVPHYRPPFPSPRRRRRVARGRVCQAGRREPRAGRLMAGEADLCPGRPVWARATGTAPVPSEQQQKAGEAGGKKAE